MNEGFTAGQGKRALEGAEAACPIDIVEQNRRNRHLLCLQHGEHGEHA